MAARLRRTATGDSCGRMHFRNQARGANAVRAHVAKREFDRRIPCAWDVGCGERNTGHIVRHQFDLHNPAEVAELIRVWRVYGSRPDIVSKVGSWCALATLTSSLLPQSTRRKFEAEVLAGKACVSKYDCRPKPPDALARPWPGQRRLRLFGLRPGRGWRRLWCLGDIGRLPRTRQWYFRHDPWLLGDRSSLFDHVWR